jgi:hypothetical protein
MGTKMINLTRFAFIATIIGFATGCYYDKSDLLYGETACDTALVTYAASVSPVMTSQCVSCHSGSFPSAGINLENYTAVKAYATTNKAKLVGSVKWDGTASNMPKGGTQWSACQLNTLSAWINQGMKP